jgi:hypothetical protein
MKLKSFFQPRWWIVLLLILFVILEFHLAYGIFTGAGPGSCPNHACDYDRWQANYVGIVIIGFLLSPLVILYLLICFIVRIAGKKSEKN